MKIRKARLDDCKRCWELAKKTKELSSPEGVIPHWYFEEFVNKKQIMIVAEHNGEVIGFRMGEELIGNGAIAHLIAVKKEYRSKNIGKKLVEEFEKECKKRKIKWILTYVYEENQKTIRFFEENKYLKGSSTKEFFKVL